MSGWLYGWRVPHLDAACREVAELANELGFKGGIGINVQPNGHVCVRLTSGASNHEWLEIPPGESPSDALRRRFTR
jgi:hypothetical protein